MHMIQRAGPALLTRSRLFLVDFSLLTCTSEMTTSLVPSATFHFVLGVFIYEAATRQHISLQSFIILPSALFRHNVLEVSWGSGGPRRVYKCAYHLPESVCEWRRSRILEWCSLPERKCKLKTCDIVNTDKVMTGSSTTVPLRMSLQIPSYVTDPRTRWCESIFF